MKTLSITNSDDNVIISSGFTLSKDMSRVGFHAGPALGLGLRPHQKKNNSLGKKAPLFIVKGPNFYIIIYIF